MAIADDYFGTPYLDTDEWREFEGASYRYVHGGFDGTDTRFAFYFPPPEVYQRRFISLIEGGQGGTEENALSPVGIVNPVFAASVGAIIVESNQGHIGADLAGCGGDSTILGWRASAESARYMRQLAAEMYGEAPAHGYVSGGSGGGIRSINCFERTEGIWDGAVPYVMPVPAQGALFTFIADVIRLLSPAERAALGERTAAGGSGDPFEGLDFEQRGALAALYRAGFPRGAEFVLSNPFEAVLVWSWQSSELMENDPGYWDDFWNVRGYAGADRRASFEPYLVEEKLTVGRVVTGGELMSSATPEQWAGASAAGVIGPMMAMTMPETPYAIVVDGLDARGLGLVVGAKVHVQSGAGAGRTVVCLGAVGDALVCSASGEAGNLLFDEVQPGDEVTVSNRDFVAWSQFHRTQTDLDIAKFGDRYAELQQHSVDGRPVYPTRQDAGFEQAMVANPYLYEWTGKMIICQNLNDVGTWPAGAVDYHRRVVKLRGEEAADRDFRVYFFDHAAHVPGSMFPSAGRPHASTRLIDYAGALQQALVDMIKWVEEDTAPPARSVYDYTDDCALVLAPTAAERHGTQPVPVLTIEGGPAARVATGSTVTLDLAAEVPPGAGPIVSVEWDVTGDGDWQPEPGIDGTSSSCSLTHEHTYTEPGVYWPSVRVTSQRDGDVDAALCLVPALAQTRLDVSG